MHPQEERARVGVGHPAIAPYGEFACSDGIRIVIGVQNEREWRAFCKTVLEKERVADFKRFRTNADRCANRNALNKEITACFGALTGEEVRKRLSAAGIAFGAVNDLAGLSLHPHLRRVPVQTPEGPVSLVSPAAVSDHAAEPPGPVPALDEHGEAIRREFTPAKAAP